MAFKQFGLGKGIESESLALEYGKFKKYYYY